MDAKGYRAVIQFGAAISFQVPSQPDAGLPSAGSAYRPAWRPRRRPLSARHEGGLWDATSTLYQPNTATLRRIGPLCVVYSRPRRVRWLHFDRPRPGVS